MPMAACRVWAWRMGNTHWRRARSGRGCHACNWRRLRHPCHLIAPVAAPPISMTASQTCSPCFRCVGRMLAPGDTHLIVMSRCNAEAQA